MEPGSIFNPCNVDTGGTYICSPRMKSLNLISGLGREVRPDETLMPCFIYAIKASHLGATWRRKSAAPSVRSCFSETKPLIFTRRFRFTASPSQAATPPPPPPPNSTLTTGTRKLPVNTFEHLGRFESRGWQRRRRRRPLSDSQVGDERRRHRQDRRGRRRRAVGCYLSCEEH